MLKAGSLFQSSKSSSTRPYPHNFPPKKKPKINITTKHNERPPSTVKDKGNSKMVCIFLVLPHDVLSYLPFPLTLVHLPLAHDTKPSLN